MWFRLELGERHGPCCRRTRHKTCLKEIHTRLDETASIAKAANACAEAGNANKRVQVALDIEELIPEARRLLDAATLMNRLAKQE